MYCPSCGTATRRELNYCNRCGATLSVAPASRLGGLVWTIPLAIALITLGGFGMVFLIGYELVKRGAEVSAITALLLFLDVIVVVIIDWMLLRQLTRVIDIYRPVRAPNEAQQELHGKPAAQIDEPREPAAFVTEQTTRMFEASRKSG